MSPLRISPVAPLVLGSGSPRRREILESLRIPFVVRPPEVDEDVLPGEDPDAYLERVVLAKITTVRSQLSPADRATSFVVLACDTSVIDGERILGKPAGTDEAAQMIARLAGRTHRVLSRFALAPALPGPVIHQETVATQVTFRTLDPSEIQAYAASGEGLDKAGGYAVQGLGASLIARIDGSYANVVGLPASELVVALRGNGISW